MLSRILLCLLCGIFLFELYITRSNLSIAIISMVQTVTKEMLLSETKREPFCLRNMDINLTNQHLQNVITNITAEETENTNPPAIKMTSTERGNLLSAFFYAYGISCILGGRLAEIYGAKKVCGIILLVDTLSNILTPIVFLKSSYWLFFTLRFITGLSQGMSYPAIVFLLSQWMPHDEITRAVAFVFIANSLGAFLIMICGGYIISLFGWEYVFYISGCVASLCLILWIFLIFDTPEKHPRISPQEKSYIIQNIKERKLEKPDCVPWFKMLKNLPIWAINIANAGTICGLNLLMTQLPIYMSSILGVDIRKNGLLSALPHLGRFVGSNASSWLLHLIIRKCHWQLKTLRIAGTIIGHVGPGISFVIIGYIGCDHWSAILLFTLGAALNGFTTSGYQSNVVDITLNFSGTAFGISNLFAFVISMMVPVVIGALTPEETIFEWRIVFWVIFAIYAGTTLFYIIFVSTEVQSWDHKNQQVGENEDVAGMLTNTELEESIKSSMTQRA